MESVTERIKTAYIIKLKKKNKQDQRLYFILYDVIKEAIIDGLIPTEINLPTSRRLAKELIVSRSTVLKAYDLLILEGFIQSKLGSGYSVKALQEPSSISSSKSSKFKYPDISNRGKSFLENVKLINTTDEQSVAFRPGIPPLDIFPVNQWKNLSNLYWRHIKSSALTYSSSSGNDQLKKNIANYLNLSRGLKCDSEQVIIVSGSLQSLYLIGSVVLNPEDSVVMENPTFPNVHSIFKSLRANIQGVNVDNEGIIVEEISDKKAKLIHTTPSGHYPTGVRLSLKRRKKLLSWANKNNSFIIENDFEHEVSNYSDSIPSLFGLDKQERTIFMGTFNRLLHPSVRIGYMVLPYPLIDPVVASMKHSHRFVPPSLQVVLNQFIEKKYLYSHVKNVIRTSHQRKQVFIDAFEEHFSEFMTITNKAAPSLHLLAVFKNGSGNESIIQEFAKRNILVHAYSKCFVDDKKKEGLILGYSSVKSPTIRRRLQQMAEVFENRQT